MNTKLNVVIGVTICLMGGVSLEGRINPDHSRPEYMEKMRDRFINSMARIEGLFELIDVGYNQAAKAELHTLRYAYQNLVRKLRYPHEIMRYGLLPLVGCYLGPDRSLVPLNGVMTTNSLEDDVEQFEWLALKIREFAAQHPKGGKPLWRRCCAWAWQPERFITLILGAGVAFIVAKQVRGEPQDGDSPRAL